MTKAEAAEVLGVAEDATLPELRRRYEALHTDYQIRLTNAPTPALKRTYQQKLQEIVAAGDTLHPGFSTTSSGGDLPSAEPMLGDGRAATVTMPRPAVRPDAAPKPSAAVPGPEAGLPRSTMVVGVVAIVLAAALSFVTLRWVQASGYTAAIEAERDKIAGAAAGLQSRIDADDRLLHADRLRVRNLSQNTLRIAAAAFVYRDSTGAMKLAHSGNYDYPTWEVRPGAVAQLDAEMARGRLWDGPVVYYSFLVEYPGVEPFLKAGVWAEDIDRLDKVVTLDLD